MQPLQLKSIIREAVTPIYQQWAKDYGGDDATVDPRQLSIDINIDYVPCTSR